jgi:hypothetical protein
MLFSGQHATSTIPSRGKLPHEEKIMRTPTHFAGRVLGCCLLAASFTFASAQGAAPAKPAVGTPAAPSQIYGKLLGILEKQFVDAAEAMPEDKFDFAPPTTAGEFKGVRTFSAEVKHVAEANYYFFGGATFTEADMKTKSDAIDKLKTKAEVVQALKDSFTQARHSSTASRLRTRSSPPSTARAPAWQPSALHISWTTTDRWSNTCA